MAISQSIVRRDFAEMARQVVKITRLLGAMRIHKRQKCQNELCDLLMKHGLYSLAASFLRARRKILLEPIENKGYFWYRGEIPYFEQKNKLLDETLFKLGYAAEKLDRLGVAKQYYEYSLHRHEPISFHRMFSLQNDASQ